MSILYLIPSLFRIGRKKVFISAIIVQIVAGLGMVIAPHWIVFGLFRAAVGFAHPGKKLRYDEPSTWNV